MFIIIVYLPRKKMGSVLVTPYPKNDFFDMAKIVKIISSAILFIANIITIILFMNNVITVPQNLSMIFVLFLALIELALVAYLAYFVIKHYRKKKRENEQFRDEAVYSTIRELNTIVGDFDKRIREIYPSIEERIGIERSYFEKRIKHLEETTDEKFEIYSKMIDSLVENNDVVVNSFKELENRVAELENR